MKAITAIHAVIVIVLGVLTIMAILALFLGSYNPAAQGVSLEAATRSVCQKINPTYCKDPGHAARTPVDNFDVNGNGILNERATNADMCVRCDQDTFEQLCHIYYGGPTPCSVSWDEEGFINTCLVKVCGCPKYEYPDGYERGNCPSIP
jgi:hypothetical protein